MAAERYPQAHLREPPSAVTSDQTTRHPVEKKLFREKFSTKKDFVFAGSEKIRIFAVGNKWSLDIKWTKLIIINSYSFLKMMRNGETLLGTKDYIKLAIVEGFVVLIIGINKKPIY